MYRVIKDKRVEASAERIREGLRKCLQSKPFDEIGVSDIAREACVSRATFYRLFDTPTDVLEYSCDRFAWNIVREYKETGPADPVESTRFILEHWMANVDMVEAIMKSGRFWLLQNSMEKNMREFSPATSKKYSRDEADYISASVFAQLGSLLMVWARHGKRETVDDLLRLYREFHFKD